MPYRNSNSQFFNWVGSCVRSILSTIISWSNHIRSTRRVRSYYHYLLQQAREQSLRTNWLDSADTASLSALLVQIQTAREIYKRSAQRLLDIFLVVILIGSSVFILYLSSPADTVAIQLRVSSEQVELSKVLPTWSIDGKADTTQSISVDRHITIDRFDSLTHELKLIGTQSSANYDIESVRIAPNLATGRVRLDKLALRQSPATLQLTTGSDKLNLAIRALDSLQLDTLLVRGELSISSLGNPMTSGVATVENKRQYIDSYHSTNVIFRSIGMDQMNWVFTARRNSISKRDTALLNFYWPDIPVQQTVSFRRPKLENADISYPSTILSGWVRILETNDTIRLGPRDLLDFRLLDGYTASVDIRHTGPDYERGTPARLITTLTGQVSSLAAGREAYYPDCMPTTIEVWAKTNKIITIVGITAWLLGILVPILFRSRL